MITILIILIFTWLILSTLQKLLTKRRLKRADEPSASLIAVDSWWNRLIGRLFGFLKLTIKLTILFLFLLFGLKFIFFLFDNG